MAEFIIDQILPVGVTLIHAKPKARLSWLALNFCYAVAQGGNALGRFPSQIGSVLYIDVISGERRIHQRLHEASPDQEPPADLSFATAWPLVGAGCEGQLREYLERRPWTRLVMVDQFNDILAGPLDEDAMCAFLDDMRDLARKYHLSFVLLQDASLVPAESFFGHSSIRGILAGCDVIMELRKEPIIQENFFNLHISGRRVSRDTERHPIHLYLNEQRKEWLA
jgi:RecA-family ATPase